MDWHSASWRAAALRWGLHTCSSQHGFAREVTFATRFCFLKTNPERFSSPVIVSEQSQGQSVSPSDRQYNDEAVTDRLGGYKIKGHGK
jgi:hypothetical protein